MFLWFLSTWIYKKRSTSQYSVVRLLYASGVSYGAENRPYDTHNKYWQVCEFLFASHCFILFLEPVLGFAFFFVVAYIGFLFCLPVVSSWHFSLITLLTFQVQKSDHKYSCAPISCSTWSKTVPMNFNLFLFYYLWHYETSNSVGMPIFQKWLYFLE